MKTRYFTHYSRQGTLLNLWIIMMIATSIFVAPAEAQIAVWSFENISSSVPVLPIAPSYKIPQVRASADLSGGNNNGSPDECSGNETWSTNFWPTSSSRSSSDYLEFSVRADPGENIDISYFSFSSSASSISSALDFDVYYSKNNFTNSTFLFSGSHSTSGCTFHGSGLTTTLLPNSTIKFRIYPYGQNNAAQAATIRIDDVSIEGGLLPVTLTDFFAQVQDGQVLLQWTTATEINNDYFAVERSPDGSAFTEIGRVSGVGNSQSIKNYEFLDDRPLPEGNYYRLRQVDLDGSPTLYRIIQLDVPQRDQPGFSIWPTTVQENLNLRIETEGILNLWSLSGRFIRRIPVSGEIPVHQLDVQDLSSGWYVLQYQGAKRNYTCRFLKQ